MPENDPAAWGIVGQIAGPIALLLAIINAWRRAGEPDEQRHRKTEDALNALANRMGLAEDRLQNLKDTLKQLDRQMEPLSAIQNQLGQLLMYFANTRPKRGDTPPGRIRD